MDAQARFGAGGGGECGPSGPFAFVQVKDGWGKQFFCQNREGMEDGGANSPFAQDVAAIEVEPQSVCAEEGAVGGGMESGSMQPPLRVPQEGDGVGAFPDDPDDGAAFVSEEAAPVEGVDGEFPGWESHVETFGISDSFVVTVFEAEGDAAARLEAVPVGGEAPFRMEGLNREDRVFGLPVSGSMQDAALPEDVSLFRFFRHGAPDECLPACGGAVRQELQP